MFKNLKNYIFVLDKKFEEIEFNEKYKFVLSRNGSYIGGGPPNSNEEKFELVWFDDKTDEITGYVEFYISNNMKTFYIDYLVSFIDNNNSFILGVKKFVEKYVKDNEDIYKIQWSACTSNPADKKYQKIAKNLEKKGWSYIRSISLFTLRTFDNKLRHQCQYQLIKPGIKLDI